MGGSLRGDLDSVSAIRASLAYAISFVGAVWAGSGLSLRLAQMSTPGPIAERLVLAVV